MADKTVGEGQNMCPGVDTVPCVECNRPAQVSSWLVARGGAYVRCAPCLDRFIRAYDAHLRRIMDDEDARPR